MKRKSGQINSISAQDIEIDLCDKEVIMWLHFHKTLVSVLLGILFNKKHRYSLWVLHVGIADKGYIKMLLFFKDVSPFNMETFFCS